MSEFKLSVSWGSKAVTINKGPYKLILNHQEATQLIETLERSKERHEENELARDVYETDFAPYIDDC